MCPICMTGIHRVVEKSRCECINRKDVPCLPLRILDCSASVKSAVKFIWRCYLHPACSTSTQDYYIVLKGSSLLFLGLPPAVPSPPV